VGANHEPAVEQTRLLGDADASNGGSSRGVLLEATAHMMSALGLLKAAKYDALQMVEALLPSIAEHITMVMDDADDVIEVTQADKKTGELN
jgi:hypothetical protein